MKSKQTENTKVTSLIADDKNFNKGSENGAEMIRKSFQKFGAGRSILLDKNNRIIAGNKSVEFSGIEDVLIVESDGTQLIAVKRTDIDLDSPQGREMALADNASAKANIVFDAELIEAELGEAVCVEWGIDVATKLEAVEDDYEIPNEIETDIVLGDLFEIGEHRLLCGDSTRVDTWQKVMNEKLCDMVMTDPPYNVDYQGGTGLKIMNDKMENNTFYQFLYDFYTALGSYTKKGGAWYVWHADSEGANFRSAFVNSGLLLKQCLVWVKSSLVMGRQDYQWKHEPCLYGWKEGAAHYFTNERTHTTVIEDKLDIKKLTKDEMKKMLTEMLSDKTKSTIIHCDKPHRSAEHPTMKPILLLAPLIQNSSKENEIVADGFLGSGSTMVASHQLKRKCYGMELDPKYCQVIIDRMKKLDPTLTIKRNGNTIT
jgi:DNA modification methylase